VDVSTYATVTDVCLRLAGRLSDDVLDTVRSHYFAGEPGLAEATLLVSLAHDGVGITRSEHDLIQSTLEDPVNSDLAAVLLVDEVPPSRFHFTAGDPEPVAADAVLRAEAPKFGGVRLWRAWREPDGVWVYVLEVASDPLRASSGLSSRLWVELKESWPVEVVVTGGPVHPYQAAAIAAGRVVHEA